MASEAVHVSNLKGAHDGWGTALKPAYEPIVVARKPLVGTVAANVLEYGTGALNIDGCRIVGDVPSVPQPAFNSPTGTVYGFKAGEGRNGEMSSAPGGRWPANVALDEDTAALLDEQTGTLTKPCDFGGDSGGASRFFYVAKASTKERNAGLEGRNAHPTVKPIEVMRWLVRMVTPPGGVVLDPFAGSGTTGIAAALEGFRFIGIESEPEYVAIARARLAHWTRQGSLGA